MPSRVPYSIDLSCAIVLALVLLPVSAVAQDPPVQRLLARINNIIDKYDGSATTSTFSLPGDTIVSLEERQSGVSGTTTVMSTAQIDTVDARRSGFPGQRAGYLVIGFECPTETECATRTTRGQPGSSRAYNVAAVITAPPPKVVGELIAAFDTLLILIRHTGSEHP